MDIETVTPDMSAGFKKLLDITSELEVGKNRRNNFGKYAYRNAEDILTALKPLCTKYHAFISIQDDIVQVGDRYYVRATVSVYDTDSGLKIAETHAFAREAMKLGGMADGQITGATSSYARKYALAAMFNLSPSDDDLPVPAEQPVQEPDQLPQDEIMARCVQIGIDYNDFVHVLVGSMTQRNHDFILGNWERAVETYRERKNAQAQQG